MPKATGYPIALADLADASAAELRQVWVTQFGSPAPVRLSGRLMRLALGWEDQAKAEGGEGSKDRRTWTAVEDRRRAGASPAEALDGVREGAAPEGTRLIKHWGGQTHEVLVLKDGARWRGQTYGSLSAVARAMTGTRRNGPRFFGLREEGRG